ncbi:MAG: hypothetical protein RJA15_285 [Actinomycetota bacterium]
MDTHQVESPNTMTTSRRQLIASLLAGSAAVVAAPMLAGRASAEGATGGTGAPHRDPADNATLNAGLERETRMAATYRSAVAATSNKDDKAALSLLLDHHVAYAQALHGYLATKVVPPNAAPLANPSGSFAQIAIQLATLEEQTTNIHIDSLAVIKGLDASTLIASIVTVEARHAAALTLVAGATPLIAAGN